MRQARTPTPPIVARTHFLWRVRGLRGLTASAGPAQPPCAIDLYAIGTYKVHMTSLQTVVELPEFLRRAKAIMSDEDRAALVDFIATNPEAGISLGGGLRKMRIAREGGGKSGGYRTINVFGGAHMPIFLITVFAKNEKNNLTPTEQAAAVALSKQLLGAYGAKV